MRRGGKEVDVILNEVGKILTDISGGCGYGNAGASNDLFFAFSV